MTTYTLQCIPEPSQDCIGHFCHGCHATHNDGMVYMTAGRWYVMKPWRGGDRTPSPTISVLRRIYQLGTPVLVSTIVLDDQTIHARRTRPRHTRQDILDGQAHDRQRSKEGLRFGDTHMARDMLVLYMIRVVLGMLQRQVLISSHQRPLPALISGELHRKREREVQH